MLSTSTRIDAPPGPATLTNGATGAPGNGTAPVKPRYPVPLPSRRAHARKKAAPLVVRQKGPL